MRKTHLQGMGIFLKLWEFNNFILTNIFSGETKLKVKKRGRPKGSKNKGPKKAVSLKRLQTSNVGKNWNLTKQPRARKTPEHVSPTVAGMHFY